MPSLRKYNISSTSYFFIGNYICMVFLKVPIYLQKWPKLKVRTYFQDTGNICVKIQLLIIFHFKILCIIYYNDIEFAQMTSVHDTHCNEELQMFLYLMIWTGHKLERTFSSLNLPKWPWVKIMTHPQIISNICVK